MKIVIEAKKQQIPEFHRIKLDKDYVSFIVQNKTNAPITFGLPNKRNPEVDKFTFSLNPGETFRAFANLDGFKEGDTAYTALGPDHTSGEIIVILE
jgi:hypothetical protein